MLIVQEPTRCLVIVLIHHRNLQSIYDLPSFLIVGSFVKRSGRTDHGYFRMFCFQSLIDHSEAFFKGIRYLVFVSDPDIFQMERFRMAGFGTHPAPLRGGISIRIFHQIQDVLDKSIHIAHRDSLLPASTGVLTTYARGNNGNRFCLNIFAELEKLVISKPFRLVISPQIALRFPAFQRTNRFFPVINIMYTIAMRQTTSRKTHKARMQVGYRLCQVGTQTVRTVLKCFLREKGDHV